MLFFIFLGHNHYIAGLIWEDLSVKIENNKRELFKDIEMLRTKMVISGHRKGLLNSETIKFSQQLDQLIYKQQCLKK